MGKTTCTYLLNTLNQKDHMLKLPLPSHQNESLTPFKKPFLLLIYCAAI